MIPTLGCCHVERSRDISDLVIREILRLRCASLRMTIENNASRLVEEHGPTSLLAGCALRGISYAGGLRSLRRHGYCLVEIQLRFFLLPWHTGLARIPLDCAAEFNQVFHIFDALLKPAHFGCERLQGWFLRTGDVTHMLSYDPSQHKR